MLAVFGWFVLLAIAVALVAVTVIAAAFQLGMGHHRPFPLETAILAVATGIAWWGVIECAPFTIQLLTQ